MKAERWVLVGLVLVAAWFVYRYWQDLNGGGNVTTTGGDVSLDAWAKAISDFESGGKADARNWRNNNPGNLKFAGQPGAVDDGTSAHFAVFDTLDSGWAALKRQLAKYVRVHPSFTLLQMMTLYLGGNPAAGAIATDQGDPSAYASFIADRLGVSVNQTLSQLFGH